MSLPIVIVIISVAVAAVTAASVYNGLIARRNAVDNAFSTIDVQLKQRCDLVPRVVASVRGYMQHERDLLDRLTALRARAVTDGLDPATRLALDAQMGGLLTHVFARAEQYPDLKAADTVLLLQRTLNEVEAQIAAARRAYNAAATDYNTGRESFPANLVAGALGFSPQPLFVATAGERLPVDASPRI
jgi:LemA protein